MQADLDLLLDQALEKYTAAEPSPELTRRILRSIHPGSASGAKRPRRPMRELVFSLPLAAALVLGVVLVTRFALPHPSAVIIAPLTPPHATNVLAYEGGAETSVEHSRAFPAPPSHGEPAREHTALRSDSGVRPRPAHYSAQELALLAFVQHHPKEAEEVMEAQKHDLDPLRQEQVTITPLQIEPITITALN